MIITVFIVAFIVSFLGSIPPGSINITTMQLAIGKHQKAAFYFALGASLTELIYAGLTVRFQIYLSAQPSFTQYFGLISSIALVVLGVLNLLPTRKKSSYASDTYELKGRKGFQRGVVLGVLNPLTIPYWLTVTSYLETNGIISLSSTGTFYSYTFGIALGTFALLLTVKRLGVGFAAIANNDFIVHKIPGVTFLTMGGYGIFNWFF